jgi:hypothetical protein
MKWRGSGFGKINQLVELCNPLQSGSNQQKSPSTEGLNEKGIQERGDGE